MKIVVFRASGRTGLEVIKQALDEGHIVTAFARTPSKINIQHPNLTLFQGDVMDTSAVEKAIVEQDAVISTLGPVRPPVPGIMETAAKNIVSAMKKHGIRRIISTTGAGVRQLEDKLMDYLIGAHIGKYRVGYVDKDSNTQFSRADGADFILKELTEQKWVRKLPLVSY